MTNLAKEKVIRFICLIPIIIWMITVFKFSNEPADLSQNTSLNMTRTIIEIIIPKETSLEEKDELVKRLDPAIRKFAHFSIYAIGGFLIMLYTNTYKIKDYEKILYAIIVGTIYAYIDEVHQIFIPGRSGQFTDIILDSIGVATGTCTCLLIIKIFNNIVKKVNLPKEDSKNSNI